MTHGVTSANSRASCAVTDGVRRPMLVGWAHETTSLRHRIDHRPRPSCSRGNHRGRPRRRGPRPHRRTGRRTRTPRDAGARCDHRRPGRHRRRTQHRRPSQRLRPLRRRHPQRRDLRRADPRRHRRRPPPRPRRQRPRPLHAHGPDRATRTARSTSRAACTTAGAPHSTTSTGSADPGTAPRPTATASSSSPPSPQRSPAAGPTPHVNAVDPGWVPTRMGGPAATDDLEQGHSTQVWLAVSDQPEANVTGQVLVPPADADTGASRTRPRVPERAPRRTRTDHRARAPVI